MRGSGPTPRVGDHLVQEQLGEGGMGAVYRVVHAPTGAVRAMKIVSLDDRQQALRFQREAEAMAALAPHEHVVAVHAAGQGPGFAWFVMDLATGGDLAERLRGGRLPPAEVVRVGVGVARGLAHLHARGLLHRDLKPSNVLFDERGAPRLADFGLVRRLDDSQTRLTETGVILGTPAYLSPEQVTGASDLDARVDVYALGMVLFEAATGRYPFDAASGALELLGQITRAPPPAPRALVPDLPPALEAVILRCLEKAPADRYASALEVAAALEAALAPPVPAPARARWRLLAAAGRRPASSAWRSSPRPRRRARRRPRRTARRRAGAARPARGRGRGRGASRRKALAAADEALRGRVARRPGGGAGRRARGPPRG
ncbi:MAG: serine/threonine protein kinase [Planctomycetes bacterium]|nr:serine/threonine protein kinase [Planctomycetota bacterium]